MEGNQLIRSLRLQNFLSYGNEAKEIELRPLNVLIGPNAAGKSNLIEALGLLRATPEDLTEPIRRGGGIRAWIWKGSEERGEKIVRTLAGQDLVAAIEATVSYPKGPMPLRYRLRLTAVGQRMQLVDEAIEDEEPVRLDQNELNFYYRYQQGQPVLNVRTLPSESEKAGDRIQRSLQREDLNPELSVLSQIKGPDHYPELTYLGNQFGRIKLYRESSLGGIIAFRQPQQADLSEDFLNENANNLALVINNLQNQPGTKQAILKNLKKFYENVTDLSTKISGGTVQLFLHEKGLKESIPATRLSDGTLRYLCLLTLLCHPTPPPVLCIEEPEIGLHPDIFSTLGDLFIEASERTQLIVTTHSDALVSGLSETPESVLVCERDQWGTQLRRLSKDRLEEWLEKYHLGDLWRMGEIGGTR